MKMAEGQRKVDGEREQRKPRSVPDMVPKPAHAVLRSKLEVEED
jgi:hypothetical protein